MDTHDPFGSKRMSGIEQFPRRCWAEIDLAALERNLKAIQATLPPHIRYIAVVKADAYGHGMHQTVARLMQAGIDMYGVANVAEAATIREIGGNGWSILILGATLREEAQFLFEYDLIPTLSCPEEVAFLDAMARERGCVLKVHLKIDTGMGRLGIWHERAPELFDAVKAATHLQLNGIYTHFAHAETDIAFTDLQRRRFMSAISQIDWLPLDDLMIHADNSAGITSFTHDSAYNAVRIGLLQFGITPYAKSLFAKAQTSPIFSFKTRVSLVKTLPAGTDVSYGRTCTLQRESRIAILCAGYGDGIPRSLSNKGLALISGQKCPYLGRVTMDQIIVDVTDLPHAPAIGDEACLIGAQGGSEILLEEFSEWAGTISWEILCSITKRVTRIYKTSIATG
ncbi:alanine racemase [Pelagicoccus sp. SDUM812003]|uniref:alanine racemase n=1 Tax=Pelagicoccus sp. SDUM812003 TaxID=3041267 RepID=UPI00281012D9|nr:alanine racemase [Pelagicoccus sp. SDUM812003]MDQ8203312.1 alanine racemase [Pelagicoccus sp. SDUM812003]